MKKKMISSQVQSRLAFERTKLANRRTFLAYFRTAVGLVVAGAGLMKFIQNNTWFGIGVLFVVLAPIMIVVGALDYMYQNKLIREEKEYLAETLGLSKLGNFAKDERSEENPNIEDCVGSSEENPILIDEEEDEN